jgi:hypothetical protein
MALDIFGAVTDTNVGRAENTQRKLVRSKTTSAKSLVQNKVGNKGSKDKSDGEDDHETATSLESGREGGDN